MKFLLAASTVALFGLSPSIAQACDLTASISGGGLQKIYDPFAPQNTVVDLRVTVFNRGAEACVGRIFVAPQDGQLQLSSTGQRMSYRVEGTSGGALPGEYGPFSANVPAGGSEVLSIQFTVQAHQVVPVGFYSGVLSVRGQDPADRAIPVGGTLPVLTMAVPARSEISISGAPSPTLSSKGMAPATINFPNAQAGQMGRVFVNVWANSGVVVRLSSENGGVLKHLQNPLLPPILYTATFDGTVLPLAGAQSLDRTPPMSVQGASYELAITLGDTTRNFAGQYRDRITVDVNAN